MAKRDDGRYAAERLRVALELNRSEGFPIVTGDPGFAKNPAKQARANIASVGIRDEHFQVPLAHELVPGASERPVKAQLAQVTYEG